MKRYNPQQIDPEPKQSLVRGRAKVRYNPQRVEKKWRSIWERKKQWKTDIKKAENPYYNLMMFPYPSAEGLHVGNVYAFIGSDIHGRFRRMQGFDAFEPMGFDSFGIHSENFAIKQGTHPKTQTAKNIAHFRKQLKAMGALFDWDREVVTSEPNYYKWTQWLFLQLYKAGLAYRAKAPVDWCPSCKTVLADEQVVNGKCERCSSDVFQKETEQWFFRITQYADRLLKNLEIIDWSERTKIAQKNWIGKSEGALLQFPISNFQFPIEVFTTRPDTLFGATYMVLAPEHPLISNLKSKISNLKEVEAYIEESKKKTELERTELSKKKTGVELKGIRAINPANREEIPIFIADYVLASYGTGAIMAVPAHDVRDRNFVMENPNAKYVVKIKHVIDPGENYNLEYYDTLFARDISISEQQALVMDYEKVRRGEEVPFVYTGPGRLMNSEQFDGMDSEKAKWEITKFVGGRRTARYHLRDWLISRQRYWGPPIPIIYCDKCGTMPVPEKDLPVLLPNVKDFRPTGTEKSPLASIQSFVNTKCPNCGSEARRETDVSDTFLDSAWYFFRYPSVGFRNSKQIQNPKSKTTELPWNSETTKKWLPVDMYIGGQEHAVLHLLYTRFITMALHDFGFAEFEEPFKKFRAHGLITKDGAKMSKSKGNVVNPDDYFKKYGADTVRMYLMFLGPFSEGGDWSDRGIVGIHRFLNRAWTFVQQIHPVIRRGARPDDRAKPKITELHSLRHRTIKKVTEDLENLRYNTAIAALMEYLNKVSGFEFQVSREEIEILLILLAPFAPYATEELWQRLGHKDSVHGQRWPKYDPKLIQEENIELILQVNGRVRDVIEVRSALTEKEAGELAFQSPKVKKWLEGKEVKKIVYVPGRLVNIVIP